MEIIKLKFNCNILLKNSEVHTLTNNASVVVCTIGQRKREKLMHFIHQTVPEKNINKNRHSTIN